MSPRTLLAYKILTASMSLATCASLCLPVRPSWATPPSRLSPTEVQTKLRLLPTWKLQGQGKDQSLVCTYQFADFVQAVDFVNQLIQPSEGLKHHPDITITYNKVSLRLTTHDVSGLSDLDFQLAQIILKLRDGAACQG